MSFKKLFLIGALEAAYLLTVGLKLMGLLSVSWIWLTSPIWIPVGGVILFALFVLLYVLIVALYRVVKLF